MNSTLWSMTDTAQLLCSLTLPRLLIANPTGTGSRRCCIVANAGRRRGGDGAERSSRGGRNLPHRNSKKGHMFSSSKRRRGRPAFTRTPYDTPLRDGNRDRLMGLLTTCAVGTLKYYLMETNMAVYHWLNGFQDANPIPKHGTWDDVSGESFLRILLSMPVQGATDVMNRDPMFDCSHEVNVDPRNLAQRVMEIRSQLAREFIQDLDAIGEENSILLRETLQMSLDGSFESMGGDFSRSGYMQDNLPFVEGPVSSVTDSMQDNNTGRWNYAKDPLPFVEGPMKSMRGSQEPPRDLPEPAKASEDNPKVAPDEKEKESVEFSVDAIKDALALKNSLESIQRVMDSLDEESEDEFEDEESLDLEAQFEDSPVDGSMQMGSQSVDSQEVRSQDVDPLEVVSPEVVPPEVLSFEADQPPESSSIDMNSTGQQFMDENSMHRNSNSYEVNPSHTNRPEAGSQPSSFEGNSQAFDFSAGSPFQPSYSQQNSFRANSWGPSVQEHRVDGSNDKFTEQQVHAERSVEERAVDAWLDNGGRPAADGPLDLGERDPVDGSYDSLVDPKEYNMKQPLETLLGLGGNHSTGKPLNFLENPDSSPPSSPPASMDSTQNGFPRRSWKSDDQERGRGHT